MLLAVGLSYMAFYVVLCSLYTHFLESFYHKSMLNFVKSFFCIYWEDHVIFILQFVNVVYDMIDVWILNHPCIPGINPISAWSIILLMYCWIQLANILLRMFLYLCSSVLFACNFLLLWYLFWFWQQDDTGLLEWIWKHSFLFKFLE